MRKTWRHRRIVANAVRAANSASSALTRPQGMQPARTDADRQAAEQPCQPPPQGRLCPAAGGADWGRDAFTQ
jgi:hypothetical protein